MFLRHNLHYAGQAHGDRAMVYNITGGVQRLQREGGTEGEYVVKEVLLQVRFWGASPKSNATMPTLVYMMHEPVLAPAQQPLLLFSQTLCFSICC